VRIAFIHHRDASNVRSWSGIPFFARRALERQVGSVVDLSPAPPPLEPFRLMRGAIRATTGKRWSYEHDPVLARFWGRHFSTKLRRERVDLVFAPAGSACIAFLKTDRPVVYYSDATWSVIHDYYLAYSNVPARTRRWGERLEQLALDRASLSLFASHWARDSAVRHYGVDADRAHTVYVGANIDEPPRQPARTRPEGRLRMLFVGVHWERKGGELARDALIDLLERGYDAQLTVVGCDPPRGGEHPRLRVIPFLNKQVEEDRRRLHSIWREADVFLLPTRAEAAGVVFCEAAAYGVPVVSTRTGGVSSLVLEGETGYLLPPEGGGSDYADVIARLVTDPEAYRRMSRNALREYEQRLSWDAWGRRVGELLPRALQRGG